MGKLKAGAAKACINPPSEWFPIPKMDLQMTGILDDLYVRAVVLDNEETRFLFLNFDCGPSADIELKEDISRKYSIPRENQLDCWTHNHSAAYKWTRTPKDDREAEYTRIVLEAVDQAVSEAVAALRPARWAFSEEQSYINANRDKLGEDGHWIQTSNFAAPCDHTLAVTQFVSEDGKMIAMVLNYGCHATAGFLGIDYDGGVKVTGGFPGYTSGYLEKRYPGAVALWNSGAAGDVNPIFGPGWPLQYNDDGSAEMIEPPPGTRYMMQKYLGETHAIDAIHALNKVSEKDFSDNMKITSVISYLQMPGHHPPAGLTHMQAYNSVYPDYRRNHPEIMVNGKSLSEIDRIEMIDEGYSTMQMQLNLLGDVAWIGASGELYAEIGLKLKEASKFKNTVIVTHTEGDAMHNGGYILSDNAKDHDTFQFYHTETKPGGNDQRIVDRMLEMFDEVLKG